MSAQPKVAIIDFDGTLCDFAFPNTGTVKKGAKEALNLFRQLGYKIVISSCRTSNWYPEIFAEKNDLDKLPIQRDRVKEMIQFLHDNELPYDIIDDGTKGKPYGSFYVDDRGLRFEDNWNQIAAWVYLMDKKDK